MDGMSTRSSSTRLPKHLSTVCNCHKYFVPDSYEALSLQRVVCRYLVAWSWSNRRALASWLILSEVSRLYPLDLSHYLGSYL